jgi:hypothetical protein
MLGPLPSTALTTYTRLQKGCVPTLQQATSSAMTAVTATALSFTAAAPLQAMGVAVGVRVGLAVPTARHRLPGGPCYGDSGLGS